MNNIKKGFSLVELLISLIVISCITAAFTPLITKKFATNIGFGGGGGGDIPSISSDCSSRYSSDCLLCTSSECLSCTKTCPEGQCQDSTNCSCKDCPESEYPNCIKFTSTACIQCQKGYRLVEGVCVACTSEKYSDNGKECKYCEIGYWPNDDKTACVECPEGYICNNGVQTKCSGATAPTIEEDILGNKNHVCAPCSKEFYCEDGVAKECSEKWKDCAECDTNGCTKCNDGTSLAEGKCVESMDDVLLIDDLYVTKFNMGDRASLPIPSTVTMLTAGSSADSCESGKCCWRGTTASASYCDSNNGGYSGCNRTICNWAAAQEICARFDLNGESWRLPTKEEASGWNARTLGVGAEGLQLCSNALSQNNDYARCLQSSKCYGAYQKYCYANYVWTNEMTISGSSFYVYAHYLNRTSWSNGTINGGYSGSVRCVATVSDCPKGQYKNGSSCANCSSKFSHCTACDSSKCAACDIGYELHPYNNKCYKVIEDAVPVDNLYVTRYNMGDGGLPIPPSVTVVNVSTGSNCTSEKCCWQGKTSDDCQDKNLSNNGGYSGCTRTVCNWYAANEICARYTVGGKTWRLPNYSEMQNWYNYTVALGASGPQMCNSHYCDDCIATECDGIGNCRGSTGDCDAGYVWAQSANTTIAYYAYLYDNSWYKGNSLNKNYAFSVRCVTEIDYNE